MNDVLVINPYKGKHDIALVGRKCYGLQNLPKPRNSTPLYVVITTSAFRLWREEQRSGRFFDTTEDYWLELESQLDQYIPTLCNEPSTCLIVRSSAVEETMRDRGQYESKVCVGTSKAVLSTAFEVWDHCIKNPDITGDIALIVQVYVEPKASGHLSNERRVSRRVSDWLYEMQIGNNHPVIQKRFSVKKTHDTGRLKLLCNNTNDLQHRLRDIAIYSLDIAQRCHYEWVWDGNKIWIVQRDLEDEYVGSAPGSLWNVESVDSNAYPLNAFLEESASSGVWPKITSVRQFRTCGLPTAQVFVLENPNILRQLSDGLTTLDLEADLQILSQIPIVIRSDVKEPTGEAGLLLPRTDCVRTVKDAVGFMIDTAKRFKIEGLSPNDYCFIVHRFIAATACALCLSRPRIPRVKIDATWGLPDGLQFYPHDSYEVDVDSQIIRRHIRCKTEYIDVKADGAWVEKRAGKPYDWKSSLSNEELFKIAEYSHMLAGCVNRPISVMYFIGVDASTGHPSCLPWYSSEDLPEYDQDDQYIATSKRRYVSDERDLQKLEKYTQASKGQETISLRLKPKPELIRSTDFIKKVAKFASTHNIAIELEGSILSHAYYLISHERVKVRCVDTFEPRSIIQRFSKLVRDLIPIRIQSQGEVVTAYKVSVDQLVPLLKAKAVEEALELYWEKKPDKVFEELADILEVIESTCHAYGRHLEDLRDLADKKREERGGFKEGIVLIETREAPLISKEIKENSLFPGGEYVPPESDILKRIHSQINGIAQRRPRARGESLVFPLIPPGSIENNEYILPLEDGRQEVVISYKHKEIILKVRSISYSDSNFEQLSFPDL